MVVIMPVAAFMRLLRGMNAPLSSGDLRRHHDWNHDATCFSSMERAPSYSETESAWN